MNNIKIGLGFMVTFFVIIGSSLLLFPEKNIDVKQENISSDLACYVYTRKINNVYRTDLVFSENYKPQVTLKLALKIIDLEAQRLGIKKPQIRSLYFLKRKKTLDLNIVWREDSPSLFVPQRTTLVKR